MVPKWERRAPGRFNFEVGALEQAVGDTLQIDEEALQRGVLKIEFDWPLETGLVPLQVIYPDSFPRIRPNVRLNRERAAFPARHCSPIDGNLCLLGRDSRQWRQKWSLCKLLELQLADALNDQGEEDEQGEPTEYWWNLYGQQGSYCLVDSAWTLNGVTSGTLNVRYRLHIEGKRPCIQAVVTEMGDSAGTPIHTWSGAFPTDLAEGFNEVAIPWMYIDETIQPEGHDRQIHDLVGRFESVPRHAEYGPSITARWFAVLYKTELGFQTEGIGWLFPFVFGPKKLFRPAPPGKQQNGPNIAIVPTYRAGEEDLGVRVPAVRLLRDKNVAVVGLGAVGAPLAIELARNGCSHLHLIDRDRVEPGNSIRWPLGASAWGHEKTESLPGFIRREYPWTNVVDHCHAVGSFDDDNVEQGDDALFEAILPNVALVVDATASYGVSTVLSDYCRDHDIPLVSLYASPPVEGGIVARFSPESGCPTCLEFAYASKTFNRAPGFSDERGLQQPPGCGERTFTGASFDLQELSLQAMRLIVQTLEYPDHSRSSEIHTLSLVSDGRRTPPVWRVDELSKTDGCSCTATA